MYMYLSLVRISKPREILRLHLWLFLFPDQVGRGQALAGDIVLCSWVIHFTLTVPLSTQVNKWVPVNLMLGVTLQWTRGE